MAEKSAGKQIRKRAALSIDGWAVAIALALVALVRTGVLKHIPW